MGNRIIFIFVFGLKNTIRSPLPHPQGILNFMEQLIEENLLPFPLDLSPYDFVATNCHTADEEASDEKEKEIKPNPFFKKILRSILKLVIGA